MHALPVSSTWETDTTKIEREISATMDVDAIEEAFLRGEWAVALAQSKEQLTHSIVEVRSSFLLSVMV